MSRTQWKLFGIGMVGFFASLFLGEHRFPNALILAPLFMLLLLGGTLGWSLLRAIRNLWNRRHGVPVVGRVIHARSSGYSNHVPTWEVEAVLPDGTTTQLLVIRFGAFEPGEPISLIVNPRDPTHATLPPTPNYDF